VSDFLFRYSAKKFSRHHSLVTYPQEQELYTFAFAKDPAKISQNLIMGSIQPLSSISNLENISPLCKRHHLKTLDIGLDGNTVSTNPFGDVSKLP
jgi:hypothetical protein